jgi:hypothetical protein
MAEALRATPRRVITIAGGDGHQLITVRVPHGPPIATAETYRQFLAILVELTHIEVLDVPGPRGTG